MEMLWLLIGALSAILIYRTGFGDGAASDGRPPRPLLKLPRHKPKLSRELQKLNTMMANIEVYDGTGRGQMKLDRD